MEQGTKTSPAVEVWKPIAGYEGAYEVSTFGRVRSLDREYYKCYSDGKMQLTKHHGRILKQCLNDKGYYMVTIVYNHTVKTLLVNRLVAKAFIPNPDNLPEVNHKDENPKNNCVENLEWCTQIYNVRYGTAIERRASYKRKSIAKYTKSGEFVASFMSVFEASKSVGKGRSGTGLISTAARGLKPSAYGFVWKYVDN